MATKGKFSKVHIIVMLASFVVSIAFIIVGVSSLTNLINMKSNNESGTYCDTMANASDERKICVASHVQHQQIYYNVILNQCLICLSSAIVIAAIGVHVKNARQ